MGDLTNQITRTIGALAGRGSVDDAQAALDLLKDDVPREPNHYGRTDEAHVRACRMIARYHPTLAHNALARILDLAAAGTGEALKALGTDVVELLTGAGQDDGTSTSGLSDEQATELRDSLLALAAAGSYQARIAVAALGGNSDTDAATAQEARTRILQRPHADGSGFSGGTRLVNDAYLVSFLPSDERLPCLQEMLRIAGDRKEAANERQDALKGARNLVVDQPDDVKAEVHAQARSFTEGNQDGGLFDDLFATPHPLSSFKINLGSASLRGAGLQLAHATAVGHEELAWVRNTAVGLLLSTDEADVRAAAVMLSRLPSDLLAELDAALLASHRNHVVRQLAAVVAVAAPERHAAALAALTKDPDHRVRKLLAELLVAADVADTPQAAVVAPALAVLTVDPRHSIRRAAAGRV